MNFTQHAHITTQDKKGKIETIPVHEYYDKITAQDIGEIARDLLAGRITSESGNSKLLCDCPNHQSISKKSLVIDVNAQAWYCFGCATGGNVLHLVEFVQSGIVTKGKQGEMPASHREARDYLASKAGLPSLSSLGKSDSLMKKGENYHASEARAIDVLTTLAKIYHKRLLNNPDILAWIDANYAINHETIAEQKIGYSFNGAYQDINGIQHPGIQNELIEALPSYTTDDFLACGAFHQSKTGSAPFAVFNNRITFPYWDKGAVTYMIGRQTPETPDTKYEGKYRKLLVHHPTDRQYVARCIDNRKLWNESVLYSKPDYVIIAEGITDGIALWERGVPVVSAVTANFSAKNFEAAIPLLKSISTVYICQDAEESGVGLKGALAIAETLQAAKITVKIAVLPRAKDESKIDVNEYFKQGHTVEEFNDILDNAFNPIDFEVLALKVDQSDHAAVAEAITPLLMKIARLSPIQDLPALQLIVDHIGSDYLSLEVLKKQVKEYRRNNKANGKENSKKQSLKKRLSTEAKTGTCEKIVSDTLLMTAEEKGAPDYDAAATEAFRWFQKHGAVFCRIKDVTLNMIFNGESYDMLSKNALRNTTYKAFINQQTGVNPASTGGRLFYEMFRNLATNNSELREELHWIHTDVTKRIVWINLNNSHNEIAKITSSNVEIMLNGANKDNIFLAPSPRMNSITFDPEATPEDAFIFMKNLIGGKIPCDENYRELILGWLATFPLVDFSITRPMLRFEGSAASGKSTASDLLTTLIYGQPETRVSTHAANFMDMTDNPLISLDNIETAHATQELIDFLLTTTTGKSRVKCDAQAESGRTKQSPKCLLITGGIEPLRGDLTEIQSRSFTIEMDSAYQQKEGLFEADVFAAIADKRDYMLSGIFRAISKTLAYLKKNENGKAEHDRVFSTIRTGSLKNSNYTRAHMYLSLLALNLHTLKNNNAGVAPHKGRATQDVINSIRELEGIGECNQLELDPFVSTLDILFNRWNIAVKLDEEKVLGTEHYVADYKTKYSLEIKGNILQGSSSDLLLAFNQIARESGSRASPYSSPKHLTIRLKDAGKALKRAGYTYTKNTCREKKAIHVFDKREEVETTDVARNIDMDEIDRFMNS